MGEPNLMYAHSNVNVKTTHFKYNIFRVIDLSPLFNAVGIIRYIIASRSLPVI